MKKNYLTALCLTVATVAMTACGGGSSKKTASDADSVKTERVKVMTASYENVDFIAEFTSNILGNIENNIAPSLVVRIDQILTDVGQTVQKGQVLVRMDPTQYNQANVQLANLESDFNRIKTVYEAGGISKQQFEQAETAYRVQKEQTTNLQQNSELRSPITGVVTARNYDPGDLYNGQTPILQIMQINTVKVAVAVSEQYFPFVKMGMPAEIRVDIYADRSFEGKVTKISPAINSATRTFDVEISIPNGKLELRPGMFSRTALNFGTTEEIMVEDVAVQKQIGSNDKYIFVAKDGKAERRNVQTGRQVGNRIAVTSGIEQGEQVIVAGVSNLDNGTPIQIIND